MKTGDRFEVIAPSLNWKIHDNIITGCRQPAILNGYGSDSSLFINNLIERGGITNAMNAVIVGGQFGLVGNHIKGFDEKGSAAIDLKADRFVKENRSICRDNAVERSPNSK
jgi:hypothetical protein